MRIPSFRRLFKEDYEEKYNSLIDTLSSSLNSGIDVLYEALNKKVSIRDNIQCDVKDVSVTVDSSGNPIGNLQISISISRVEGITVIMANNQTNPTLYPTSGVLVNFTQKGSLLIINNITGLQANNEYNLRLLILG